MSLQTGAPPPDESCTMSVSDILYTHFLKFRALGKADHRQTRHVHSADPSSRWDSCYIITHHEA